MVFATWLSGKIKPVLSYFRPNLRQIQFHPRRIEPDDAGFVAPRYNLAVCHAPMVEGAFFGRDDDEIADNRRISEVAQEFLKGIDPSRGRGGDFHHDQGVFDQCRIARQPWAAAQDDIRLEDCRLIDLHCHAVSQCVARQGVLANLTAEYFCHPDLDFAMNQSFRLHLVNQTVEQFIAFAIRLIIVPRHV